MINDFRSKYAFLSNFYECKIEYDGLIYNNSEAVFQAMKSTDIEIRKQFINLNGKEAKFLGRKIKLREDWDKIKEETMHSILTNKFSQNKDLMYKLLYTKEEELVEGNTWHDNCWGNCSCEKCKDIEGQNKLGKLLMTVRETLRNDIFKVIIAGGRDFDNYEGLKKHCDHILINIDKPIEIVSGTANGADKLGEKYAKEKGYLLKKFPADWEKDKKRAGYLRNRKMGEYAEALIAFWNGSLGTGHMIDIAKELDLKLRIIKYANK